jgi:hypothetical protein
MGRENFVVATRPEAAAPMPRAGTPARKKYAFPVANEICTHFGLGAAVTAAGELGERARLHALQL